MASDGSDNPILDMGLLGMMQPNPYLNPAYANKPLALPGFRGVATNAMGQPIQGGPPQGTTLNTPPPQATAAAPDNSALINYMKAQDLNMQSFPQGSQGGFGSGNGGPLSGGQRDQIVNNAMMINQLQNQGASPAAASSAASPASGGVDQRQAYLDALSNPGNPPVVGAAVPASHPLGVPSVLNTFLAAHPSGGSKTGGYDNTGFFSTR